MFVSRSEELENGRGHYSIGRIKAASGWRAADVAGVEEDRAAAVRALIRAAEDYDADAILGLDFEIDGLKRADIDGASLRRVAATGVAVKFAEAA
jgi:uncharacterized protein YbjQ (UPF0145 family)